MYIDNFKYHLSTLRHSPRETRTSRGQSPSAVVINTRIHVFPRAAGRIETSTVLVRSSSRLSTNSPETLEGVVAQAEDAALLVSESGTILFANDRACRLLKYALGELDGLSVELLVPKRFRLAHVGYRLRFMDDQSRRPMGAGLELFALCKDGSERPVDISLIPARRGLENLMVVTIEDRA
jgi:PAS domain S-box-containing protein